MEETTQIDLGPFLAAVVENAGGEIRLPYGTLVQKKGDRSLIIDIEDDGATIVLRMADGILDA